MNENHKPFIVGEKIFWMWMGCKIYGEVKEIHSKPVAMTIKGKLIKRNGSATKPAYLVQSEAGNLALKLHSELSQAQTSSAKRRRS